MILDFNDWDEYNGFSPGGGASEKEWIINNATKEIGLFKFPKNEETYEHFSEKLASELANIIDLKSAKIDIGNYEDRMGSISYLINDPRHEELREGIWLIYKKRPYYSREKLQDVKMEDYYSLEMILEALDGYNLNKSFFEIMIFDYLIGNRDRHESNWAVLDSKNGIKLCPLYDNGSSLCCYISDEKIKQNQNNTQWIDSVVNTKSKSRIRIDKENSKEPTHLEVICHLKENYYKETIDFVNNIKEKLTKSEISNLIEAYSYNILSDERKEFLKMYLVSKVDTLIKIYKI